MITTESRQFFPSKLLRLFSKRRSMETSKKEENDNSPSEAVAMEKRQTKRKKRVNRDPELLRVQDAVEHILVAGAKVRRDDWRRQEFYKREENRPTTEAMVCPPLSATMDTVATSIYSPRQQRRKRKRQLDTGVYHAEDLRIYGKRHNSHLPAFAPKPTQSKSQRSNFSKSDDTEWNFEHGDSVPPILFRMARLSGEYPSEEEFLRFNDPNATLAKSLTSTNVTLEENDVPRALIEKCWERAIHIASNALVVPVTAAPANTATAGNMNDTNVSKISSSIEPFDINTPLSQDECREKCKSLGVDLDSLRSKGDASEGLSDTTCPRCTRSFPTTEELIDHFYGTTQTTGCCRALIRPRHLQLIRNLLQKYAENQTDQLGALLVNGSKQMEQKQRGPFGWRDVRQNMMHAVENSALIPTGNHSSHPHTNTRHPVQQSMQLSLGMTGENDEEDATNATTTALPLMLNPMILEAVNRRLIDRYADVPP